MWTSLLKHVTDCHVWQDGECSHGPIPRQAKTWVDKDSGAMKELRRIVMDVKWLKTMKFYTKFRHTGMLESYHNARLKYACKRVDLR